MRNVLIYLLSSSNPFDLPRTLPTLLIPPLPTAVYEPVVDETIPVNAHLRNVSDTHHLDSQVRNDDDSLDKASYDVREMKTGVLKNIGHVAVNMAASDPHRSSLGLLPSLASLGESGEDRGSDVEEMVEETDVDTGVYKADSFVGKEAEKVLGGEDRGGGRGLCFVHFRPSPCSCPVHVLVHTDLLTPLERFSSGILTLLPPPTAPQPSHFLSSTRPFRSTLARAISVTNIFTECPT